MSERKEVFTYKDRIVAFIDILGFKEAVLQRGQKVTQVIEAIDRNLEHVLESMKREGGDWYSAKLFSDCMSISCDNYGSNLYYMLNELSYLQLSLATQGLFVRGAIAYGPHYENDRIIFSEGLIRAYELEQKANYPRIIISDSVLDLISREPAHYRNELYPYLLTPPDGACSLDYLQHLFGVLGSGIDVIDFIVEHKQALIAQVQKHLSNAYILDKYKWVAEYHNHKVPQFYDRNDYEEKEWNELMEKISISMSLFPSYRSYAP
jgi:hypothetical protein